MTMMINYPYKESKKTNVMIKTSAQKGRTIKVKTTSLICLLFLILSLATHASSKQAQQYRIELIKLESQAQVALEKGYEIITPIQRLIKLKASHIHDLINQLSVTQDELQQQKLSAQIEQKLAQAQGLDTWSASNIIRSITTSKNTKQSGQNAKAAPIADDLTATIDANSNDPAIISLAGSLNNNPVAIFNYIRENTKFTPTLGSIQGASATLESHIGNATDTASLMIATMRAAGIPARYVQGTIEIEAARLKQWINDLDEIGQVLSILNQSGLSYTTTTQGGLISSIQLQHTWVEVWVDMHPSSGVINNTPQSWVALDASYKLNDFLAGIDLASSLSNQSSNFSNQLNAALSYDSATGISQILYRNTLDTLNASAQNQIVQTLGQAPVTMGDLFGHLQHIELNNRLLPASLPYTTTGTLQKFSQLNTNDRHQLALNLYATELDVNSNSPLLSYSQPLPKIASSKLTIKSTPATPSDALQLADIFANVTDLNSLPNEIATSNINVIVELTDDTGTTLQTIAVPLGFQILTELTYSTQQQSISQRFKITAGENRVMSWNLQGGMQHKVNTINQLIANLDTQSATADELTQVFLQASNIIYLGALEIYNSWLAAINQVVYYQSPSFVSSYSWIDTETFFDIPTIIKPKGIAINAQNNKLIAYRNSSTLAQSISNFNQQSNRMAAHLSSFLLNNVYAGTQINASQLLIDALNNQQTILHLNTDNSAQLNTTNFDSALITTLQNQINQGYDLSVNAQLQNIQDYTGTAVFAETAQVQLIQSNAVIGASTNSSNSHTGAVLNNYAAAYLYTNSTATIMPVMWSIPQASIQGLTTGINAVINAPLNSSITPALLELITPTLVSSIVTQVNPITVIDYWLLSVLPVNISSLIDPIVPTVALTVQPNQITLGESATITAIASDNEAIAEFTTSIDGQAINLDANDQYVFTPDRGGQFTVQAIAIDTAGNTSQQQQTLIVIDPNDNQAPIIDILTPADGDTATGIIDISIRVQDPNLSQWQLSYRDTNDPAGTAPRTLIVQGTAPINDTTVASWDTSMLRNGIYVLVLEAIDINGLSSNIANSVFIEGDLKIGNFQIAFEDLNIPVAGIPVTITRSYDTRNRNSDEAFGKGWEIGYQSLQLTESRVPGLGWYQQTEFYNFGPVRLPRYCIESIGDRLVTIRMPDDSLEKFKVKAKTLNTASDGRINCQDIAPPDLFSVEFIPQGDTNSTLTTTDIAGGLRVTNGNLQTLVGTQPIDPNKYTLTLQDGTIYSIDQGFNLTQIEATDGNSIKFTYNGIEHNNGYAVQFIRDSQDRIRFIQKPNGERIEYAYNANGDLISHTDLNGNTTTFNYILDHYIQDIIDPRGIMVARNEYDADGRLIAHIDANGNRIEYTHDIQGRTETIKDRNGNASVFVYDNQGSVIAETNPLGETTFHEYNAIRLETKRIDPLGNETLWTYDNAGNQLTETDSLGNTTTSTYNQKGEILTQTDALGNAVITNAYSDPSNPFAGGGNLDTVTDAIGNITQFHWTVGQDANLNTVVVNTGFTDAKGNRYDVSPISGGTNNGLSGATTDLNGLKTESTYDDEARPLTESQIITDVNDVEIARYTTTFEYNANGDIIKTIDTLGNITSTEYNALNKVSATIDTDGNRTTYEFDDRGNPSKTIFPDGTFETTAYDLEGNAISSTDRAGRVTKTLYDAANRVTQVILPDATPTDDTDNPRTSNTYDNAGRLIAVTDALGNVTSYQYDTAGKRTTTTDALGNVTTFVYDNLGRRIQSTDALGRVTHFEYNTLGNLTKTTFPNGTFTSTVYDELSRKIAQTDLAGRTTQYEYSKAGNLTAVIDALGQRTEYEYDQRGNKTIQRDANLNETSWTYDELARVASHTLPEGQTETFSYDARGNLASKTDFNGDTTTYAYNNLNQLILTTYADGTTVANTYTTTGQTQTMTDTRGVTSYQYDEQNRLTRLDYPNGNFTAYQYDKNGNRTLVTTNNQVIAYSFDALNRSSTVTDTDGITSYTYDSVGNRATQVNSNGTTATYSYDALNRLTNLVHTDSLNNIIASYQYILGANGNRQSITEATGRIVDYAYDALYRLLTETITDPVNGNHASEFAYDAVGNRLQQIKDGIITTYVYNNNDQILSETENAVVTSYAYDNNGNTLNKTVDAVLDTSYSYNKQNQLIQAITPTSTISNTYDPSGIRQSQTVDGITTNYLVGQNRNYAQVLEEQNDLFIPQGTYVYGDDLIKQTQGGVTHTFGYDGLGSTRILTDGSGTVQNAYGYEAFGEVDYQLGTVDNKYLFTGEQYDNNVGFYYLRARFYNPGNGRFTQMDRFAGKIGEPTTLHKYLYTGNNPINLIDPSGNFSIGGLMAGIAVGAIIGNYAASSQPSLFFQRLNFSEKEPVAYIDFSTLNVPGIDNGFLKTFILNQVGEYYAPYDIKIKSGKGDMLDRRTVFRSGLESPVYGRNIIYFNRVWANQLAELFGSFNHRTTPSTITNPSKVAMAIANTVTHEMGHGFGLDHNSLCFGFIMDNGLCGEFDNNYDVFLPTKKMSFSPTSHNYLSSRNRN